MSLADFIMGVDNGFWGMRLWLIGATISILDVYVYVSGMTKRPKIRLSRLRDIGWSTWDPIGLLENNQSWEDVGYADEYDSYLLIAAGMLRRKKPKKNVVDYLIEIETQHMGLSHNDTTQIRAEEVVHQIENDDKLWSFPAPS